MTNPSSKLFLGRLGKEPDLRYTKERKPVCILSVATINETEQKTDWHRVVVWGKQAELCNLYLKKGKQVFVHGHRELKEFVTSEGVKTKYEEVKASLVGFSNV